MHPIVSARRVWRVERPSLPHGIYLAALASRAPARGSEVCHEVFIGIGSTDEREYQRGLACRVDRERRRATLRLTG